VALVRFLDHPKVRLVIQAVMQLQMARFGVPFDISHALYVRRDLLERGLRG
jgi:hypothetical protein